jgi:hypothetical protein
MSSNNYSNNNNNNKRDKSKSKSFNLSLGFDSKELDLELDSDDDLFQFQDNNNGNIGNTTPKKINSITITESIQQILPQQFKSNNNINTQTHTSTATIDIAHKDTESNSSHPINNSDAIGNENVSISAPIINHNINDAIKVPSINHNMPILQPIVTSNNNNSNNTDNNNENKINDNIVSLQHIHYKLIDSTKHDNNNIDNKNDNDNSSNNIEEDHDNIDNSIPSSMHNQHNITSDNNPTSSALTNSDQSDVTIATNSNVNVIDITKQQLFNSAAFRDSIPKFNPDQRMSLRDVNIKPVIKDFESKQVEDIQENDNITHYNSIKKNKITTIAEVIALNSNTNKRNNNPKHSGKNKNYANDNNSATTPKTKPIKSRSNTNSSLNKFQPTSSLNNPITFTQQSDISPTNQPFKQKSQKKLMLLAQSIQQQTPNSQIATAQFDNNPPHKANISYSKSLSSASLTIDPIIQTESSIQSINTQLQQFPQPHSPVSIHPARLSFTKNSLPLSAPQPNKPPPLHRFSITQQTINAQQLQAITNADQHHNNNNNSLTTNSITLQSLAAANISTIHQTNTNPYNTNSYNNNNNNSDIMEVNRLRLEYELKSAQLLKAEIEKLQHESETQIKNILADITIPTHKKELLIQQIQQNKLNKSRQIENQYKNEFVMKIPEYNPQLSQQLLQLYNKTKQEKTKKLNKPSVEPKPKSKRSNSIDLHDLVFNSNNDVTKLDLHTIYKLSNLTTKQHKSYVKSAQLPVNHSKQSLTGIHSVEGLQWANVLRSTSPISNINKHNTNCARARSNSPRRIPNNKHNVNNDDSNISGVDIYNPPAFAHTIEKNKLKLLSDKKAAKSDLYWKQKFEKFKHKKIKLLNNIELLEIEQAKQKQIERNIIQQNVQQSSTNTLKQATHSQTIQQTQKGLQQDSKPNINANNSNDSNIISNNVIIDTSINEEDLNQEYENYRELMSDYISKHNDELAELKQLQEQFAAGNYDNQVFDNDDINTSIPLFPINIVLDTSRDVDNHANSNQLNSPHQVLSPNNLNNSTSKSQMQSSSKKKSRFNLRSHLSTKPDIRNTNNTLSPARVCIVDHISKQSQLSNQQASFLLTDEQIKSSKLLAQQSVLKRIESMLTKQKIKLLELKQLELISKAKKLEQCTFQPQLSQQTIQIANKNKMIKIEKLKHKHKQMQETNKDKLFLLNAFNNPNYNNQVPIVTNNTDVNSMLPSRFHELYQHHAITQAKLSKIRQLKQMQQEEKFNNEHTFKPQIARLPPSISNQNTNTYNTSTLLSNASTTNYNQQKKTYANYNSNITSNNNAVNTSTSYENIYLSELSTSEREKELKLKIEGELAEKQRVSQQKNDSEQQFIHQQQKQIQLLQQQINQLQVNQRNNDWWFNNINIQNDNNNVNTKNILTNNAFNNNDNNSANAVKPINSNQDTNSNNIKPNISTSNADILINYSVTPSAQVIQEEKRKILQRLKLNKNKPTNQNSNKSKGLSPPAIAQNQINQQQQMNVIADVPQTEVLNSSNKTVTNSSETIPLCYVDISLSESLSDRITVYNNDNPNILAAQFVEKHKLNKKLTTNIENMLKQQIQQAKHSD